MNYFFKKSGWLPPKPPLSAGKAGSFIIRIGAFIFRQIFSKMLLKNTSDKGGGFP